MIQRQHSLFWNHLAQSKMNKTRLQINRPAVPKTTSFKNDKDKSVIMPLFFMSVKSI